MFLYFVNRCNLTSCKSHVCFGLRVPRLLLISISHAVMIVSQTLAFNRHWLELSILLVKRTIWEKVTYINIFFRSQFVLHFPGIFYWCAHSSLLSIPYYTSKRDGGKASQYLLKSSVGKRFCSFSFHSTLSVAGRMVKFFSLHSAEAVMKFYESGSSESHSLPP